MNEGAVERPRVAAFRPADERLETARRTIEALGGEPVLDPMLEIDPTGERPRGDAAFVVFTSKSGVDIVEDTGWEPNGATICAIGGPTAARLRAAGFEVAIVPETFTSRGLVEALAGRVSGERVEVARSDHGSPVLLEGLMAAGAYVHETVLYELRRPAGAGHSIEMALAGELDVVLFTSSLTVEHLEALARERGHGPALREALAAAVVGAIGEPTRATAEERAISVDFVAPEATFDALAREGIERALEG